MTIHRNDTIRFLDSVRVRQQDRKRIEWLRRGPVGEGDTGGRGRGYVSNSEINVQ